MEFRTDPKHFVTDIFLVLWWIQNIVKKTWNKVIWASLDLLHMTDCSHTRESYRSHKLIGAACRNHNATCRQKTYDNAEPKSVVNWAPVTPVLFCQTCTFYVTRLAKRKLQQLTLNRKLVTYLWRLRVHMCIHLHTSSRPPYALPHALSAGHIASKPFCALSKSSPVQSAVPVLGHNTSILLKMHVR